MNHLNPFLSLLLISILLVIPKFATADIFYVSTTGSDSSGNGSAANPWLTITHALNSIIGTPANPHTIFVEEGVYSPSTTGETFPLNMKSYVSLQGAGDSLTTLDAESEGILFERKRIITCDKIQNILIDGFTLKNGYQSIDSAGVNPGKGGGIYIFNSAFVTISNNQIQHNFAADMGGGIGCDSSSYILITGNTVFDNIAGEIVCSGIGGGISFSAGFGMISNNTISNNATEYFGGGIFSDGEIRIINNKIINNFTGGLGGGVYVKEPALVLRNSIINNQAIECLGGAEGGGIIFYSQGIIGGSLHNGNNIYNNYVVAFSPVGHQMAQLITNNTIDAQYNYFGSHNPHDPGQIYGNFIVDPYLVSLVVSDTSKMLVIPSPVDFDSVMVNQSKTLKLQFFNVANSLFDSLKVFDIIHEDTLFSISQTSFILQPIGEDSITVSFSPSAVGIYTDTLRILYIDGELKVALKGIAIDTSTTIVNNSPEPPLRFAIHQNYPNPFNFTTHIRFDLPLRARVTLKIYNVMGQEVHTLFRNKTFPAGTHEIDLDIAHLSSGIYFYRIQADTFTGVRKMLLIQ